MESEQKDALSPQEQLLAALELNDLDTFRNLLRSGRVDPRHRYGKPHYGTCVEIASRRPHGSEYVRELLSLVKPNVNVIVPEPVHHAAKRGHADVLTVLLADKRTKANAHDSDGRTALHYACMHVTMPTVRGYESCVKLLMGLFSPADINRTDTHGYSAIHAAARYKPKKTSARQTSITQGVSEGDADLSPVDEDQTWEARKLIIKVILDLGRDLLDIDSVRAQGRTAREDLMLRFPDLEKHLPAGVDTLRADPHSALANSLRDGRIDMFRALLQETNADGTPTLDPNYWFGAPLHATCLEMACKKRGAQAFVSALLVAGADPNTANKLDEKFPIHVACEKGHHQQLVALFEGSEATDPNARDKLGNTGLHFIIEKWSKDTRQAAEKRSCLEILLEQKNIDVNRKNNKGFTALMLAFEYNNKFAAKTIIAKKSDVLDLSVTFRGKELRDVIINALPDMRDRLLSTDDMHSEDETEWFDLLHNTREDEFVELLQEKKPQDLSMNDKKFTLLQRAARYGMEKAVSSLLKKGADANATFRGNLSPPLVLACFYRHKKVAQIVLKHPDVDVNVVDAKGNTALHYAAREDADLDTVVLLLRRGADIKLTNRLGKTALGADQVQSLLDQCVSTNGKNALEDDYELVLDYRLLAPGCKGAENSVAVTTEYQSVPKDDCIRPEQDDADDSDLNSEMEFIHMISKNEELNALLDHPIARSFLELKWSLVKPIAYFNLGVYVAFMLFLNVFIINSGSLNVPRLSAHEQYIENNTEHFNNTENSTDTHHDNATKLGENTINTVTFGLVLAWLSFGVTLLLWVLLCFREVVHFTFDHQKYIGSVENYLDWSILLFGFVSLTMPVIQPENSLLSVINVIAIMLSCAELLLLLGRISNFAKYIEMLRVVLCNYSLPLVSYCVIIVAFGLSFHTLFRESKGRDASVLEENLSAQTDNSMTDFSSWHMAIVKSLVMMTGELNFDSYPDRSPLSIFLFVVFVLLVTVVLLNILVGLAVNDTQKIEAIAQQLRLKTRVELVLYTESILVNMHKSKWRLLRKLASRILHKSLRGAILFPGSAPDGREARVKPNVQSPELVLGRPRSATTGRHQVEKELLDRATLIISRRSVREAARASEVNLGDVNAKLDRVLTLLAGRSAAGERAQVRLDRMLSVAEDASATDAQYSSVFSEGDES